MELTRKVSDIRGILVIAYEEGLRLGKVSDIYIDKKASQIKGISFKTGLLGIEKESFVSLEKINILGKDVVIISSKTAVTPLPKELKGTNLKALKGFRIITRDGAHIGELYDLKVIKDTGKISKIILAEDKMLEIEAEDITIGADVIMVPADYTPRVKQVKDKKAGILSRLVGSETVKETVKKTVKETVEKVGKTTGEVLKKSEPKAEKIKEKSEKKRPEVEKADMQPEKLDQKGEQNDKKTVE